jgi:hypothetical protein
MTREHMGSGVQENGIWILPILVLFASISFHSGTALAEGNSLLFVGMEYPRLHFAIDHSFDVEGTVNHFFTSRPIEYLGWRFAASAQIPISNRFGSGWFFGIGLWKTGYWLNREITWLGLRGSS